MPFLSKNMSFMSLFFKNGEQKGKGYLAELARLERDVQYDI